ncbi:hypothetical protein BO99DRAFT_195546 [Aspergillus violaceofuscus CBS 115571]|uniref:Uncharacterized protein n=1 Tax=Aspergillus violaceofuscus (strain CBS 115571) TaxID=1450538 RepID=A0A2V5H5C7_ASPV1|nr:hypothetical protein BO99DRAFT_195546 [Aspergillus violaceofuscus CBS 115571]
MPANSPKPALPMSHFSSLPFNSHFWLHVRSLKICSVSIGSSSLLFSPPASQFLAILPPFHPNSFLCVRKGSLRRIRSLDIRNQAPRQGSLDERLCRKGQDCLRKHPVSLQKTNTDTQTLTQPERNTTQDASSLQLLLPTLTLTLPTYYTYTDSLSVSFFLGFQPSFHCERASTFALVTCRSSLHSLGERSSSCSRSLPPSLLPPTSWCLP